MKKLEMNPMVAMESGQKRTLPDLIALLAQVFGFVLVLLPLLGALVGFSLLVTF